MEQDREYQLVPKLHLGTKMSAKVSPAVIRGVPKHRGRRKYNKSRARAGGVWAFFSPLTTKFPHLHPFRDENYILINNLWAAAKIGVRHLEVSR